MIFQKSPVTALLDKLVSHTEPYKVDFRGMNIVVFPGVFNPAYTKVSRFLAENLDIRPNETCCEMFCGTGAIALFAAQRVSRVVGLDLSPVAIDCAQANTMRLGLNHIATFRRSNLWNNVDVEEKFHVILANPPLIPAHPESLLEAALADSPTMEITKSFILGCGAHLYPTGRVYMVLSDACKVSVGDPLQFALTVAQQVALTASVKATLDVGHEMYYLIQLQHSLTGSGNSRYDLHTAGVFA